MRKLIYLFWLSLLFALPVNGRSEQISERDMKTALIYNFAVFTTWPLVAGETFNITENTTNTGIINILLINNRFNFTINNETARDSNLTLSSRLLRLAAEVY